MVRPIGYDERPVGSTDRRSRPGALATRRQASGGSMVAPLIRSQRMITQPGSGAGSGPGSGLVTNARKSSTPFSRFQTPMPPTFYRIASGHIRPSASGYCTSRTSRANLELHDGAITFWLWVPFLPGRHMSWKGFRPNANTTQKTGSPRKPVLMNGREDACHIT